MIRRFCLYGFLKNQRYFEPFWILAFLDKGLSFTSIGLLIAFREACVAILEIPTGAVADVAGRRWAMICSHLAYVVAFLVLGAARSVTAIAAAMFVFAIGEAFRTGTHKAMIFAWLNSQGRQHEKTAVYGVTRSWSQMGSAVSVVIAAAMVFVLEDYSAIFWMSALPTSLNILNFLSYPRSLDAVTGRRQASIQEMCWRGIRQCLVVPRLRRPLLESMGYEGMFKASQDYLQPIVQQLVIGAPLLLFLQPVQRTAATIAFVYAALHLLGSLASRRAGRMVQSLGHEERAARWLWLAYGATFVVLLAGTMTSWNMLAIASFLALSICQNLWRPILIGRVASRIDEHELATVLSIESQAKSLGVVLLSPLLGLAIDLTPAPYQFAPLAVAGMLISGWALASFTKGAATSREVHQGTLSA